jgi:hypothetical protein
MLCGLEPGRTVGRQRWRGRSRQGVCEIVALRILAAIFFWGGDDEVICALFDQNISEICVMQHYNDTLLLSASVVYLIHPTPSSKRNVR